MSNVVCHVCEKRTEKCAHMYACFECGVYYSTFPYDPSIYNELYRGEYWRRYDSPVGRDIQVHRREKIMWKLQHHMAGQKVMLLDFGCGPESPLLDIPNISLLLMYDPPFGHFNNMFVPCDAVTFFDSFEHLENPHKIIELTTPGLVYITIPILPMAYHIGEAPIQRWKHYKPREHLILFTYDGIKRYMEKLGYSCYTTDDGEKAFGREDVMSFTFLKKDAHAFTS